MVAQVEQIVQTCSEEETEAVGATLAQWLFPGAVLLLAGELGAGKTAFARGIGRGLGVSTPVQSPTFTLMHAHQGRLPFYHFDLYRLEAEEELFHLGMEEFLDGDGVSVVEWAGKFPTFFTQPTLHITITAQGETCRQISFASESKQYEAILYALSRGVE